MMLLWIGAGGALLFPAVFLVDGWLRRGYSSLRHTVSALATGSRSWLQTVNFILCGTAITIGAAGLVLSGSFILAAAVAVFGLGLVLSGVFPMDPMRGYPPGTARDDPQGFSTAHRLHDAAGAVVFFVMPVMPAVLVFTGESWTDRIIATVVAAGLIAGVTAFTNAWEKDGAFTGLVQKLTLTLACGWLALSFALAA